MSLASIRIYEMEELKGPYRDILGVLHFFVVWAIQGANVKNKFYNNYAIQKNHCNWLKLV